MKNVGRRIV